jgi:hypothetical protein
VVIVITKKTYRIFSGRSEERLWVVRTYTHHRLQGGNLGVQNLDTSMFFFFDWTPQMRNKNRTLNKLVMRPWKLGNLDVNFFDWTPPNSPQTVATCHTQYLVHVPVTLEHAVQVPGAIDSEELHQLGSSKGSFPFFARIYDHRAPATPDVCLLLPWNLVCSHCIGRSTLRARGNTVDCLLPLINKSDHKPQTLRRL